MSKTIFVKHIETELSDNDGDNQTSTGSACNESESVKERKKRVTPTREILLDNIQELTVLVSEQIKQSKIDKNKPATKQLQIINKKLKVINQQAFKIVKNKPVTQRKPDANSGFKKPMRLSDEMINFAGWDKNEYKSRIDVTRFICQYIKENNLQNPEDKRKIIPNDRLKKLLDYNSEEPLRYGSIQTYLKKHFIKDD